MKRVVTILLACALLCGCWPALAQDAADPYVLRWYFNPDGGQYAHIDPNCTSVSAKYLPLQPLPDEMRDQKRTPCPYCAEVTTPIFSAEGSEGALDLHVDMYATTLKVPEWEDDPVYRLRVVDRNQPDHAFAEMLFPSLEGNDSNARLVWFEDMNFDGYPDLAAVRAMGASNRFCRYFLYSPADNQFHHEPALDELSGYSLHPDERIISNSVHDSASTGIRSLYHIGEDGRPLLIRRAEILHDEQSGWKDIRIKVSSYDSAGVETVLMNEVRPPFRDEADYGDSELKWLSLLYDGIPEAVIKRDLGW